MRTVRPLRPSIVVLVASAPAEVPATTRSPSDAHAGRGVFCQPDAGRPSRSTAQRPARKYDQMSPSRSPERRAWSRSLEDVGRRDRLRHPRRRDPPGVRPAVRLARRSGTSWSATSRAPATPPRATPRPPAGSASAWRPRARARPTWSRRSPTPTWTRCRSSRSPARCRAPSIGTDAFQEADIRGITMPITKHNFLVTDPAEIPRAIAEAFHIASTGRPGPVLVDIAKDALQAHDDVRLADRARPARLPPGDPPARQADPRGGPADRSRRSGRCCTSAAASSARAPRDELRVLAELTGIPVVTTLMARGAFPDSHPQHLGMPGMHGTVAAVDGAAEVRPAHHASAPASTTGSPASSRRFAPDAKVIHADIDPAEISKNRTADVPIVGDCQRGHRRPDRGAAGRARGRPAAGDYAAWWAQLDRAGRTTYPLGYDRARRRLAGPAVRHRAARRDRRAGGDLRRRRRPAPDVGRAVRRVRAPGHLAQLRRPRHDGLRGAGRDGRQGRPARTRTVWAIDGDGCFQMTNQELATCAINDIPIKVAIINNAVARHGAAVADAVLQRALLQHRPAAARAAHPRLRQARRRLRLRRPALRDARATSTRRSRRRWRSTTVPVVVDFVVHRDAMVWPMVAGRHQQRRRSSSPATWRPAWDEED